ncbi:MAG: hypothetical protein LAT51_06115 [Flavobacteriaceae bacterium]|nr:hypothetical protein [Flavobacteriaceae bacterium]
MNVLITGIGGPTPLGVIKSLKIDFPDIKVIGVDANKFAPGHFDSNYDKTYIVPKANELDYWDKIDNIIYDENIDIAFVIPETEVLIWAKRDIEKKIPCKVLLPDFDVANFLFDKLKVSNLLEPFNLSPMTIKIDKAVFDDKNKLKLLGYPFWVRVNKTAGALGAMKIGDFNELTDWLKINEEAEFIASTYLPGRNYAAKILFFENEVLLTASGERIEYLMPNISPTKITGMCARGRLLNNDDLVDRAEKAIRHIFKSFNKSISGMFTVDFKEDISGNALITEINIRPVSFIYAFSLGGANFPSLILKKLLYNEDFNFERVDYKFKREYDFVRGVDYPLCLIK